MTTNKKIIVWGGLLAIALGICSIVVGVTGYYRENTTGATAERIAQTFHHTHTYTGALVVITISFLLISMAFSRERI